MTFQDIIKSSIIKEFHIESMDWGGMLLAVLFSVIMALYLYVVYRFFVRKSMYNMNMNISIVGMTVITTAVILTIQSNLILSLGMVGALSIVRYRTAVKDPMDLFFLFWAIVSGIMCGASQYILGIIITIILTCLVFILSQIPTAKAPYILVINAKRDDVEDALVELLGELCTYHKIKSRNISEKSTRIIVELRTKEPKELTVAVKKMEGVTTISLLTYEGDVVA